MPVAYARTKPHLRVVVLARLELGETLAQVCRAEGMPTSACVWNWARKDGAYWVELVQAQAKGAAKRPPRGEPARYDEACAKAIVARMAAGDTIRQALKAAGGPSYRTFLYWRATQAEFQEGVARLSGARRAAMRVGGHPRWRAFDQRVADKILVRVGRGEPLRRVLASDAAFPCLAVVARWRRERPEFAAEVKAAMRGSRYVRGARRLWSEALEEEIVARIIEGASLRAVAADPAMPCGTTIRNWLAKRPGFAHAVEIACQMREEMMDDEMLEIARAATEATAGEAARAIGRLRFRAGGMRRGRGGGPVRRA